MNGQTDSHSKRRPEKGRRHGVPLRIMLSERGELAQLCPILCDPMDCSPTGSSVHGIFQARVLEWVAIAFSDYKDWSH